MNCMPTDSVSAKTKIAIVTGANKGIGKAVAAEHLCYRGAFVTILACRNKETRHRYRRTLPSDAGFKC